MRRLVSLLPVLALGALVAGAALQETADAALLAVAGSLAVVAALYVLSGRRRSA